ncbi:MAG: hypothetical protein ACK4YO_00585 [Candidatus Altarchaeaceae archaeon]
MKENNTKVKRQRKESLEEIKRREERKRKLMIIIMIFFGAGTFIIADLYYGITNPPQIQERFKNPIDNFFEMNFKADNIIFEIKNFTDEYYIFPKADQRFDWQTLQNIKNLSYISSKGIEKIEIDFIKDRGIGIKFKVNKTANFSQEEILDDIFETYKYIVNIEDKNRILGIYKGYVAMLPKTSENEVYIFALPSTKQNYVIGSLYLTNISQRQIGIQSDIVEDCSIVSAYVLNITSVNVDGEIYDLKFINKIKEFNVTLNNLNVENPKIVNISNESLAIKNIAKLNPEIQIDTKTNNTIIKFKNFVVTLNISNLTTEENLSKNIANIADRAKILNFEYNSSKEEIEEILENANYSIVPGKISFEIDPKLWNDEIYNYINKSVTNLKIEKEGKVKVRRVCVTENKLVIIPNNENFNAKLNLDTNEGNKIIVGIAYYSMMSDKEERLIPYMAIEKKE